MGAYYTVISQFDRLFTVVSQFEVQELITRVNTTGENTIV